ncbi:MmcQ/YjbR family DNA-binding protein [uncultured Hoeflea sp.]|uniref:MmcQ/YjbR family DNA-binding protein n=1 Tax=uncultured Hoeflea sp. TaxID=538666 RepID=UPI0030D9C084
MAKFILSRALFSCNRDRMKHQRQNRLETFSMEINEFCLSLLGVTHVVQWGGSDVYKVGGKVFAIISTDPDNQPRVTFKASEMSFEMLKSEPGMRPAPYLASRGFKWLQRFDERTLDDQALRDYIRQSHAMVLEGLSKKKRLALQNPGSER